MKRLIVVLFVLILGFDLEASRGENKEGYQSYLTYEGSAAFKPPVGRNAPLEQPLEELRKILFKDETHLFGKELYVLEREHVVKKFPCSNCHLPESAELWENHVSPHKDIHIQHGHLGQMDCFVCHNENNRDLLKSPLDNEVSFNQAAKMCYSCHSTQYKNWLGGAHGKRVGGWAGERVILSCTSCHNPHNPGFSKRMSSVLPRR